MKRFRVFLSILMAIVLAGMATQSIAHQVPCDVAPKPQAKPAPFVVSAAEFDQMFPHRSRFYTYESLVSAAKTVGEFAGVGDLATRKREAAALLANASQETGGLRYTEQMYGRGSYCDTDKRDTAICVPGRKYYGRGPILLSWALNYRQSSFWIFGDDRLSKNPDQVAQNPTTAWKTNLWYWMTQGGHLVLPPHDSIVNGFGFGQTISAINGYLECGERATWSPAQRQRIDNFVQFIKILKTTSVGPNNC